MKKLKTKRTHAWFIEPLDEYTNFVISQHLAGHEIEIINARGRSGISAPPLWRCPLELIKPLVKSRKSMSLKFKIYSQQGMGQVKECTFLFFGRKKRRE